MRGLTVKLGSRSYNIKIGEGILAKAGTYVSELGVGRNCIVITNPKIKVLYGDILKGSLAEKRIKVHMLTVPDSESSKSCKIASKLLNRIAELGKWERPCVAAFGGGVVGDLAGFIAAVYRRGVPFIQIPTTLVAQVDSSIGGKVAIDLPMAKNLIGAFYQPKIVISDTSLLRTLPAREVRCGLSEIIKYSIISSRKFFDFLSANILSLKKLQKEKLKYVIAKCSAIKAKIVSIDEKDVKGARAILNYGHTIGHAIEAASGYKGLYNHGEAIAIGMIAAAYISNKSGLLSSKGQREIKDIIKRAGLPVGARKINSSKVFKALCHDKKFTHGVNRFVLPLRIGRVKIVENISDDLILEAIREVSS